MYVWNEFFRIFLFPVILEMKQNASSERITLVRGYQIFKLYFTFLTQAIMRYYGIFSVELCLPIFILLCND